MAHDEPLLHERTMKVLCLHGFRTSGSFLQKQLSKWNAAIFSHFTLEFPNGIFPAGGKSEIEGLFPPPYFEWFQFNEDFTDYTNLEQCISYLTQLIQRNGPFDGLLGFSQGATLSALLLGYQAQGKLLREHPSFKFFVSISGTKFRVPSICEVAYKEPINVKSVHFIGDRDWLKVPSEELASAFHCPIVIGHPQGHTVPRLDDSMTEILRDWTSKVLQDMDSKSHTQIINNEEEDAAFRGAGETKTHENGCVLQNGVSSQMKLAYEENLPSIE